MSRFMMRILLAILAPAALSGCGLIDSHVKQMDVLNGMATKASESLKSGALTSVHASGLGLNPGITVEAAIVYRATARYEGLAGQFSIAQTGESAPMTADAENTVNAIFRDKSIRSGETRTAVIDAAGRVVGYWTATGPAP